MRPSIRNGSNKFKFSTYHNKRKKKPNSQKNRSAQRRKDRIKFLREQLKKELNRQHLERKRQMKPRGKLGNNVHLVERRHNLAFQQLNPDRKDYYAHDHARLIARVMQQIKDRVSQPDGMIFIQQYYITKGLKVFGQQGKDAAMKELGQLVNRNCWKGIHVSELSESEKKKAVEAMMLLALKHTGEVKGRYVYKGNDTRGWLTREETASPTASLEGILVTCVIDAHEDRDIMTTS